MIFITKESDLNINDTCVLYFYSSWIPYHKKMLIMLDKMEKKYPVNYFAIDVDNFKGFCKRFLIESVPTVLILKGKETKKIIGMVLTSAFKKVFNDIFKDYGEKDNEK